MISLYFVSASFGFDSVSFCASNIRAESAGAILRYVDWRWELVKGVVLSWCWTRQAPMRGREGIKIGASGPDPCKKVEMFSLDRTSTKSRVYGNNYIITKWRSKFFLGPRPLPRLQVLMCKGHLETWIQRYILSKEPANTLELSMRQRWSECLQLPS